MPGIVNTYLRYDAASIEQLMLQKLAENPNFTDQIFQDSNLRTLLQTFANLFQVLTYYLNHGASEAMFSDTTLYDNISRMVKMVGYTPKSFQPGAIELNISNFTPDTEGVISKVMPKYTALVSDVNNATYSTSDNYYIFTDDQNISNVILAYEGKWKLYPSTFTATGVPNELVILRDLYTSDATNNTYVSTEHLDVFIKRVNESGEKWIKFKPIYDSTLFVNQSGYITTPNERLFMPRINENKQIEIQFGDGINGELLEAGDEIYIVYLESTGANPIGTTVFSPNSQLGIGIGIAGMQRETFEDIFQDELASWLTDSEMGAGIVASSPNPATAAVAEEDVDTIRENAPKWVNSAGRLVTLQDYDSFIKTKYRGRLNDVKVMNNFGYMRNFYRWLYDLGNRQSPPVNFLNKNLSTKYDYPFADACDFNNIYIFLNSTTSTEAFKRLVERELQAYKIATNEIVLLNPLIKQFAPCGWNSTIQDLLTRYGGTANWDPNAENYFEVLVNNTGTLSPETIRTRIKQLIVNYFSKASTKIGGSLDFSELYNSALQIDGVKRIRTIFAPSAVTDTVTAFPQTFEGFRFAFWTPNIVRALDIDVSSNTAVLEDFHVPLLYTLTPGNADYIADRIRIITDSISPIPVLEY
jgi:hypothetical protein